MKSKLFRRLKADNDTGFGTSSSTQGDRLVNRDGSYNVIRSGVDWFNRSSHFHNLITMPWARFNLIILLSFLSINVLFALAYWLIGTDKLGGMLAQSEGEKFLEAFFFSCQTFSTVGYGRINPTSIATNSIASLEALVGLMCFALATGLLYGRFSRPNVRLTFSNFAVVAPYLQGAGLMMRFANIRKNQLLEVEVDFMVAMNVEENGNMSRRFFPLKLERKKITSLALSWTIVHPIDAESPIFEMTQADLEQADAEFLVLIKAFDDTYSQTVHTRTSYRYSEIRWGYKFVPMYRRSDDGNATVLELDKINTVMETPLQGSIQGPAMMGLTAKSN